MCLRMCVCVVAGLPLLKVCYLFPSGCAHFVCLLPFHGVFRLERTSFLGDVRQERWRSRVPVVKRT